MSAIVPEASQADMLADIVRDPCTIRLYVNDPGDSPTAADFQELSIEGVGYQPKPIRATGWDMSRAPALASYGKQTWQFSGPAGVVRGYYITRNSDGRLRWFDPLPGGPMNIANDGDQIAVSVELSFGARVAPD